MDEISSMSRPLQARLLRVIQEREILRIGGDRIIPVDVRIISATNDNLFKRVQENNFREDLFYRINELNLTIPPLRERKSDIPELVRHFLINYYCQNGPAFKDEFLFQFIINQINTHLAHYHWPGNVRELENLVKRCIVLYDNCNNSDLTKKGASIFQELIFSADKREPEYNISVKLGTLKDMEEELIKKIYARSGYNKTELADMLGISRSTLWRRLKDSPEPRQEPISITKS